MTDRILIRVIDYFCSGIQHGISDELEERNGVKCTLFSTCVFVFEILQEFFSSQQAQLGKEGRN